MIVPDQRQAYGVCDRVDSAFAPSSRREPPKAGEGAPAYRKAHRAPPLRLSQECRFRNLKPGH